VRLDGGQLAVPAERLEDGVPGQHPARRPVIDADLLDSLRADPVDPAVADVEPEHLLLGDDETGHGRAHRRQSRVVGRGGVHRVVALLEDLPDRVLAAEGRPGPGQEADDQRAGEVASGVTAEPVRNRHDDRRTDREDQGLGAVRLRPTQRPRPDDEAVLVVVADETDMAQPADRDVGHRSPSPSLVPIVRRDDVPNVRHGR